MKLKKRWVLALAGLAMSASVVGAVFAQEPSNNQPPAGVAEHRGEGFGGFMLMCSTANPTEIVATALGMSAADLRVALVSGQSVSDLAASKNVDMQTIQDALATARQAELDQALKDGLITQEQYDAIKQRMENMPAGAGNEIRVPDHNIVHPEAVAAEALGMSCADLVKAQQSGKAIAEIATDKGVAVQTVIDAVTTAVKDALAQDVKEGLITQAQADGRLSNLTTEIGQWVYSTGGMHQFGGPGGGFGHQGGPNGGPDRPGQQGNGDMGPRGQHGGNGGPGNQPQPTVVPNS